MNNCNGCESLVPEAAMAARSCKKPRKGARPVPGPIMISGAVGSDGSLKVDLLR